MPRNNYTLLQTAVGKDGMRESNNAEKKSSTVVIGAEEMQTSESNTHSSSWIYTKS